MMQNVMSWTTRLHEIKSRSLSKMTQIQVVKTLYFDTAWPVDVNFEFQDESHNHI